MKLWKFLMSEGSHVGVAVVRAETKMRAIELAQEYAKKEGLGWWLDDAIVKECPDGEGIVAWGEA